MKYICSLIVVENIERSRKFYEKVLGQTVQSDFGENVAFEGGFAIHQKKHFQSLINSRPITTGGNCSEIYFEHDDLPPIVKKIKDIGLEFIHEIVEQPWKQQVIRFYDYDKNIIEVGERMEHTAYRLSLENYSTEDIAKITYLTPEAVEKAIKEYSCR